MFRTCPRQFFYEYFPHGEPNANELGLLKNLSALPLLVGNLTHEAIGMALRLFKASGKVKTDLKRGALIRFDDALAASARNAAILREGRTVSIDRRVLDHHLEEGPSEAKEAIARESLASYLDAFEGSCAWEFIRGTDRSKWEEVKAATDPAKYVEASREIGFRQSIGLRIYTPFDLALMRRGEFIIVDWKTGTKTGAKVAAAKRQTASYALWALAKGKRLEIVRRQPFWLQNGEPWAPQPISEEEIGDVRRGIVEHDKAERKLIREQTDRRSNVTFHAKLEDFPPTPGRVCRSCKYRFACVEGQRELQTPQQLGIDEGDCTF